jgi:hypothetical protein
MIASGATLTDVLEDLRTTIDARVPNLIFSVTLMEPAAIENEACKQKQNNSDGW